MQLHSDRLIHLAKLIMRIAISKSEGLHRTFQTEVCLPPATTNGLCRDSRSCLQYRLNCRKNIWIVLESFCRPVEEVLLRDRKDKPWDFCS